ncbi:MAG: DUF2163 domain-containing protein [Paracoccus sp. (in: a-proteobacteria)]
MTTMTIARAWAITRADGLTLGFTDHDVALEFAGITFHPDAGLSAQAVVQGTGLAVDNTEAIGALSDGAIEEGEILAGFWDGAELRQWDVDWRNPVCNRLIFRGHLGEVTRAGGAFKAELRGLSEPLNQPQGRVFHPRCSALLGDRQCKVDMSQPGLTVVARIRDVDGARLRLGDVSGYEDRWFHNGAAEFLGGAAKGIRGHIKNDRAVPGGVREIDLWTRPGIVPAIGDEVRLEAGCDKAADTCRLKFANFLNFRGFPHLPEEDWLMAPSRQRAGRLKKQVHTEHEGGHD